MGTINIIYINIMNKHKNIQILSFCRPHNIDEVKYIQNIDKFLQSLIKKNFNIDILSDCMT